MTPQISQRGRLMPASSIRKLMPLADEAKRRGTHVYHLNIGQPDLETPEVMRRRLQRVEKVLAYTPSGGTPEYLDSLEAAPLGVNCADVGACNSPAQIDGEGDIFKKGVTDSRQAQGTAVVGLNQHYP